MCGIVGYNGTNNATNLLLEGLAALEYRGYDSAGVALVEDSGLVELKSVGRVGQLTQLIDKSPHKATAGIGHTRWATHGEVTLANSHPHSSADKTFSVVHNGIIENHNELRLFLEQEGYVFQSQTDTEVIPHLLQYHFEKLGSARKAFEACLNELRGAYAIAMASSSEPDVIYGAKLSSPLVVGVAKSGHYIASDPTALPKQFSELLFLDDYEYVRCTKNSFTVTNFQNKTPVSKLPEKWSEQILEASKGGFDHFLIKEIHDAPETIRAATAGRIRLETRTVKLGGLENVQEQLKFINRIVIVACGTSYFAGLIGEYLIEELAGIPVEVQLASEFKYRNEPFSRSTALLAISQSGETADTIAALKKVEKYGVLRLGVVNAPGSTIARMTDAGVYCHAGPERSVASTKAFVAQVSVLSLIALSLAQGTSELYMPMLEELSVLDAKVQTILDQKAAIQKVAKKYSGYKNMLYIGRRYGYPAAAEGALKLKEVSYLHAEGYAAGEMKHGPLAMVDPDFPTFAIAPHDDLFAKTVSSIEEIRARKGKVIAITDSKNTELTALANDVIVVPKTLPQLQPILSAVVMHLFAYYVAVERKLDVDRPRNLAKSVTVE